MALTRNFKDTILERVNEDPEFRRALLRESVQCMLDGDMESGKTIMRDYINATIGFKKLGLKTHKQPKSLMRMFGPNGNPQARNLFEIIAYLKKEEGMKLKICK